MPKSIEYLDLFLIFLFSQYQLPETCILLPYCRRTSPKVVNIIKKQSAPSEVGKM